MSGDSLLNQLLGIQSKGEIPVILVKRNLPHPIQGKIHETGWVGLRKTMRRGKTVFEKNHNFKLAIEPNGSEPNGTAKIPDCEENRARLDRLCKPQKIKVPVREKNARGLLVKKKDANGNQVFRIEERAPLYERLDVKALSTNLLDAIIDRMEERGKERGKESPDSLDRDLEEDIIDASTGGDEDADVVDADGAEDLDSADPEGSEDADPAALDDEPAPAPKKARAAKPAKAGKGKARTGASEDAE